MNGSNWFVIQQLNLWLAQGIQPWLATVIETYGSSPRPEGSMMIYHPAKGIIGSLSGGCIEQELIAQLAKENSDKKANPIIIRYGDSPEQRSRLALPCGGHMDVLLEKINQQDFQHFKTLENALHSRQWISRHIDLKQYNIQTVNEISQFDIQRKANKIIHALKPHDKLLLIGAGEVSRCLAEICKNLEFEVTLCDFRDEFLQGWQVDGVQVIKTMPDDLITEAFHDNHCAIVALAHDPRVDDMAMMQALKTEAFYVGAMGSLQTSNQRRARLAELELNKQQIEKLHAPIGLDIHSRTPYEIAVSIAAHLVSARAER
ncbi:MAG: XdhC family protein [Oleispira sp.]|nr:XdhC family protein [Oleispira sp.]MBL4880329.1 XdhC family protein [Oleispira sp.]